LVLINIVLVEPEIPQNTGNIARTCAAAGARLHLIKPLGFVLTDRRLRRAGADYWGDVDLVLHDNLEAFFRETPAEQCLFFSTKAARSFREMPVEEEAFLVFGKETEGLPDALLAAWAGRSFRVPMRPEARSLNLSNAVAVVLYEALRLRGFPGLT
jgi:tRNA (cytidine/uridine-2'-O-)-methyltransferase